MPKQNKSDAELTPVAEAVLQTHLDTLVPSLGSIGLPLAKSLSAGLFNILHKEDNERIERMKLETIFAIAHINQVDPRSAAEDLNLLLASGGKDVSDTIYASFKSMNDCRNKDSWKYIAHLTAIYSVRLEKPADDLFHRISELLERSSFHAIRNVAELARHVRSNLENCEFDVKRTGLVTISAADTNGKGTFVHAAVAVFQENMPIVQHPFSMVHTEYRRAVKVLQRHDLLYGDDNDGLQGQLRDLLMLGDVFLCSENKKSNKSGKPNAR